MQKYITLSFCFLFTICFVPKISCSEKKPCSYHHKNFTDLIYDLQIKAIDCNKKAQSVVDLHRDTLEQQPQTPDVLSQLSTLKSEHVFGLIKRKNIDPTIKKEIEEIKLTQDELNKKIGMLQKEERIFKTQYPNFNVAIEFIDENGTRRSHPVPLPKKNHHS